jgi:ssDNA-binding Zn-finger/Zn-ribbon topoisomerase 1
MADAAFADRFMETFRLAVKLKAALKEKGKRRGWTKCPRCGGRIVAVLAGRRDHLHMARNTPNCIRMME